MLTEFAIMPRHFSFWELGRTVEKQSPKLVNHFTWIWRKQIYGAPNCTVIAPNIACRISQPASKTTYRCIYPKNWAENNCTGKTINIKKKKKHVSMNWHYYRQRYKTHTYIKIKLICTPEQLKRSGFEFLRHRINAVVAVIQQSNYVLY